MLRIGWLAVAVALMLSSARAQSRLVEAKDVSVHLRLASRTEIPLVDMPIVCRDADPERLDCRLLTLELTNLSGHLLFLPWGTCSSIDWDLMAEVRLPGGPWRNPTHEDHGHAQLCTANIGREKVLNPGQTFIWPFRLAGVGHAAVGVEPLTGPLELRITWYVFACVEDAPQTSHCSSELSKLLVMTNEIALEPETARRQ